MDAERTLSATAATAKAVNKAIETIKLTNNTNQATELRIHNLETTDRTKTDSKRNT